MGASCTAEPAGAPDRVLGDSRRFGVGRAPTVGAQSRYLDKVEVLQHHDLFSGRQRGAEPQQGGEHCAPHVQRGGGCGQLPQNAGAAAPGPGRRPYILPRGCSEQAQAGGIAQARGTPSGCRPARQARGGAAHRAPVIGSSAITVVTTQLGPCLPAAGCPGLSDCASYGQRAVPGCRGGARTGRAGPTWARRLWANSLRESGRASRECLQVRGRGRWVGSATALGPAAARDAPSRDPSASVSGVTTRWPARAPAPGPCAPPRGPGRADDTGACTRGPAGWAGTAPLVSRAGRRTWAPTPC